MVSLPAAPVSDQKGNDDDSITTHSVSVGFRLFLGPNSLQTNDREGVGLDLPRFTRWVGMTDDPLE